MSNALPSSDLYNEAVQNPQLAFNDRELKNGSVAINGFGLPLPISGAFALTYQVKCGSKMYAVRVFHRSAEELETRYEHIHRGLCQLGSPYFLDFEFQSKGIQVRGNCYPIVKMAWASGSTLGEFLDQNFRSSGKIRELRSAFRLMGETLAGNGMAHGDIQTGNVMYDSSIKLLDYDGMFVRGMPYKRSSELGHRHFQHPDRTESTFGPTMDRFSLILIDFSLELIAVQPGLFQRFGTTGENILFNANDFRDPRSSQLFQILFKDNNFSDKARRFAALCKSSIRNIPVLEDFDKGVIPNIQDFKDTKGEPSPYVGAYPVLDAKKYHEVLRHQGQMIELIGKIEEVHRDISKYRRPYVFINFGDWRQNIVKINIWDPDKLSLKPDSRWKNSWISITGVVDPRYKDPDGKYTHLSITVTTNTQLRRIDEATAKYRLGSPNRPNPKPNNTLPKKCDSANPTSPPMLPYIPSHKTPNQDLVDDLDDIQPTTQPNSVPITPLPLVPAPVGQRQSSMPKISINPKSNKEFEAKVEKALFVLMIFIVIGMLAFVLIAHY